MRVAFPLAWVIVIAFLLTLTPDFAQNARIFPIAIGVPAIALLLLESVRQLLAQRRPRPADDSGEKGALGWRANVWFYSFVAFAFLIGVHLAGALFVFAYMRFEGRVRLLNSAAAGIAYWVFLWVATSVLSVQVVPGVVGL